MGRRPPKSAFIPDAFVFPGGKLDPCDWTMVPARQLAPEVEAVVRATNRCTPARATALANAAVRETYEETGLMIAAPAETNTTPGPWADFSGQGLAPDHGPLQCLARAITPPQSPMRFHARFFVAYDCPLRGELRPNDELLDLAWVSLDEAQKLPIIDVTEAVLNEASQIYMKAKLEPVQQNTIPLLSYRRRVLSAKR